jgi:site-specific DNA-methyltransferase (adenine-specific)
VVGKRTDGRYAYDFQDGNAQFVTNNRDNGIHTNTDKIGMITAPATPEAKALEGSYGGFQPKPAVEVIIVAMKPMDEKTFTSQALANGHGITWLDDCRIPYASNDEPTGGFGGMKIGIGKPTETQEYDGAKECNTKGRFPANLLVSDDVLNDGRIIKGGTYNQYNKGGGFDNLGDGTYNHGATINDKGSYSRYFDLDAWSNQLPFLIVPKASKKEKNAGCEELEDKENESLGTCQHHCRKCGKKRMCNNPCTCKDPEWYMPLQKNNHPTVKPLRLMSYLITMGSRPNQVVLDPFAGSGTTLVAAKQLGRRFIGIEMSAEYVEIINARLNAV